MGNISQDLFYNKQQKLYQEQQVKVSLALKNLQSDFFYMNPRIWQCWILWLKIKFEIIQEEDSEKILLCEKDLTLMKIRGNLYNQHPKEGMKSY